MSLPLNTLCSSLSIFHFYIQAESRIQTLSLELESLKADVVAAEEALETAKSALKEVNDDASAKQIKVGEVKALFDDALSALQTFEDQLAECDAELSKIKSQKKDLSEEAEASRLESKKLSVQISRIQKERQHAESKVAKLLKEYSWIESEKSAFGVAGGDYDFEAINTTEMSHQLKTLKSEQDSLVSHSMFHALLRPIGSSNCVQHLSEQKN